MYSLGYDLGSSSIKAAVIDIQTLETKAQKTHPPRELHMISNRSGWAEQNPEEWWENLIKVTRLLIDENKIDPNLIQSIGIAYQMHGLVAVDQTLKPIRPSIIWCDSRAVDIGKTAFKEIGEEYCLQHFLNAPGNFTASKLAWVQKNERDVFNSIYKFMLPGDYIAAKLTGEICTTVSGMSEGVLWNFITNNPAYRILDQYKIPKSYLPAITKTFGIQGRVQAGAALQLGIKEGIPVSYRAGDQPNNALSLNVLNPGEIAATGGTSGVIYAVTDKLFFDPMQRVNSFAHVNHTSEKPRIGVLLCINGSGIMYNWIRHNTGYSAVSYSDLEKIANTISIGSEDLKIFPFGNGAERMFQNKNIGVQVRDLQLNTHHRPHLIRAALEGIAFSFVYGIKAMQSQGIKIGKLRVGNDNLFQSDIFSNSIANVLNTKIEVIATTGAVGAALASAFGVGYYKKIEDAFSKLKVERTYEPGKNKKNM